MGTGHEAFNGLFFMTHGREGMEFILDVAAWVLAFLVVDLGKLAFKRLRKKPRHLKD